MAHVLLNALASTAGGGLTYLQNVLPRLAADGWSHRFVFFVPPESFDEYRKFETPALRFEKGPAIGGALSRMIWEQRRLRNYIIRHEIDLLVALGNFALFASPVPQILFNRNDLYFSPEFSNDLRSRGLYSMLLSHNFKSRLARASMRAADLNVAPTVAFAERIRRAVGDFERQIEVLPFGFDHDRFFRNADKTPPDAIAALRSDDDLIRILFVSHYNYFRNFETLIAALPRIRERIKAETGREVRLVLTTDIRRGAVYGGYDAGAASDLIDKLRVRDAIDVAGVVGYDDLYHLYRSCDLYVCPSYSESFGHPLVEAMAAGLPLVSADLPVHREVCRDAAVYFDVFDPEDLADRCLEVLTDPALAGRLRMAGQARSRDFSWDEHVKGLNQLIDRCLKDRSKRDHGSN